MQTHACQRVAAHPLTDSRRSLAAICGHHSNGNQNSSQTAPKHVRLFLTHTLIPIKEFSTRNSLPCIDEMLQRPGVHNSFFFQLLLMHSLYNS